MNADKIFRDPVHGYISIDHEIVANIIDSPQFQRLKRIKQGNLDVLFPTANQTRFEHSLGVYYLGRKFYESLLCNAPEADKEELLQYRSTVGMACLLHDIGHAPLSHIGEDQYHRYQLDDIRTRLAALDIKVPPGRKHASHELMSVLVGLTIFRPFLEQIDFDKDLFFRMITGSLLNDEGCQKLPLTSVRRGLIQLLNSCFDVDKMDYILRDANSAGVYSVKLDIERIIGAAKLVQSDTGERLIAFGKSGFSVISSIVTNRNYLYTWIYGHHKVMYHATLLSRLLGHLSREPSFTQLFSYDAITGHETAFGHHSVVYTDDHDMWHIFKNHRFAEPHFDQVRNQLFLRNHYKPLWKTKIEYDQQKSIFSAKLPAIRLSIEPPEEFIQKKLLPYLTDLEPNDIIVFLNNPKIVFPDVSNKLKFWMTDPSTGIEKLLEYSTVFPASKLDDPDNIGAFMFHIFVNSDKDNLLLRRKILTCLSEL